MKKLLVLFCLVLFLLGLMIREAECVLVPVPGEVTFTARDEFRDIYRKSNDVATDAENGVEGQHTKITVTAAELPYPLLRYRFNMYITETESGNAAPLYAEAVAKLNEAKKLSDQEVYRSEDYAKAQFPAMFNVAQEKRDDNAVNKLLFRAFPVLAVQRIHREDVIAEKEKEDAAFAVLKGVYYLIEKASKKRECDWSYWVENKGLGTLLPNGDAVRKLGKYLQQKAEWEIRYGKYDNAVKTIRLGLRLAEHTEQSDMPGAVLIIIAYQIKKDLLNVIQLLAAQPDAPNLYPALTQIHIDKKLIQRLVQTELFSWMSAENSSPQKILELFERTDEINDEECKVLLTSIVETYFQDRQITLEKEVKNNVIVTVCLMSYLAGKERLLNRGLTEAEIDKLSVYQVTAPHIAEQIKVGFDKMIVASMLPVDFKYVPKDTPEDSKHTRIDLDEYAFINSPSPSEIYLSVLSGGMRFARHLPLQNEQTIDLLQITEAIRHYAAVNNGKLPETLDQIDQLHVKKISATTNKPLTYHVKENTAIIDYKATPFSRPKIISRLEITVEKNKK
jgi:hypothetical protein